MKDITNAVCLRDFAVGDADAVISLWTRCGLTRPWNNPNKDIHRKLNEISKGGTGWFWVAELDGRIVGAIMAGYDGHRGSVNYLAVDPSVQGQGLGRWLMKKTEVKLATVGCPKINLLVRTDNQDVQVFYERLGYSFDKVAAISRRLIDDETMN